MAPESETALIQRAQQGDTIAFGELVKAHQTFVYNLALRTVGHPFEAQDLAQEAFIKAWQGLAHYRMESRFSTWLYRIVVNLCYNRNPRLKRDMEALAVDEDEALPSCPPESDPVYVLERNQQRETLIQMVSELPPAYRMLIQLRYQQGLAYDEIAKIMVMPLGTVKTGLFRAHAQLRATLLSCEELGICTN